MADIAKGRNLVILSLAAILLLNLALSAVGGDPSNAASNFGRPAIVALGCLLVWQGRLWARWLVALMGLGVLLAGPIGMANGLRFFSVGGLLSWTASWLYFAALFLLFRSQDAQAYLAARARGSGAIQG